MCDSYIILKFPCWRTQSWTWWHARCPTATPVNAPSEMLGLNPWPEYWWYLLRRAVCQWSWMHFIWCCFQPRTPPVTRAARSIVNKLAVKNFSAFDRGRVIMCNNMVFCCSRFIWNALQIWKVLFLLNLDWPTLYLLPVIERHHPLFQAYISHRRKYHKNLEVQRLQLKYLICFEPHGWGCQSLLFYQPNLLQ